MIKINYCDIVCALNVLMKKSFIHKFIRESFDGGNKHKWNKNSMASEQLYRYVDINVDRR